MFSEILYFLCWVRLMVGFQRRSYDANIYAKVVNSKVVLAHSGFKLQVDQPPAPH